MTATAAERLPSGRRSRATLSREDVTKHQRERILAAMTSVVAEVGYGAVTVAAVTSRAGVSRATFYEQFTDRQDCFLAAFDRAADLLIVELAAGSAERVDPVSFSELLTTYLDSLVRKESYARVLLLDIATLGPQGVLRRAASQRRIAARLADLVDARTTEDLFACEALVAAVGSLVSVRLAQGDLQGIYDLHGPLTNLAHRLFAS